MPLVDGSNTGYGPALVVQDLVGNVRSYAETCHSRHHSSTKIVKRPAADPGRVVETLLCLGVALKRGRSIGREHKRGPREEHPEEHVAPGRSDGRYAVCRSLHSREE